MLILRRNEKTWKKFKGLLLSERRQFKKNITYCRVLIIRHCGKGKTVRSVKNEIVFAGS